MDVHATGAPVLPGHSWRSLDPDDALRLHQLELECAPTDGLTSPTSTRGYQARLEGARAKLTTDTLCAVDTTGRLAAFAWVTCDKGLPQEYRAFLDGRVRPDYRGRGVGSFILQWMESRAREMLSERERDRPRSLRIEFYDRGDDAIALFQQHGFRFAFAEDEMWRDLEAPLPAMSLPGRTKVVTWSPERAPLFFGVYQDAFRERPGFPGWSEDVWRDNFTGGSTFRPDLSVLLLEDHDAVGFAACHVETDAVGWIAQMGVRSAWRTRGLGAALLCEVMRRFQAEGLACAALNVNIDNASAQRLYRRLGFERRKRRTIYQKAVGPPAFQDGESP